MHYSESCFLKSVGAVELEAEAGRSLCFTICHLFPPKNCPFPWGMWTPCNMWFLGPTLAHNPNGIMISLAVFAGLTSVTDRQTDHATRSVTIGCIYVRSTVMQPNNNKVTSITFKVLLLGQPVSHLDS